MTDGYNTDYYDAFNDQTADIAFYRGFVDDRTSVLELGCGSGRVTTQLYPSVESITGVDLSSTMLQRARDKLPHAPDVFVHRDITQVVLDRQFDLIIAPFRVLQALEHTHQVSGLFSVIQAHLAPDGMAILNVFQPNHSREKMATDWPQPSESEPTEHVLSDGSRVVCTDVRRRINADRQVLYPELIYRRYRDGALIDEHIHPICMRYYYPQEFLALIEGHGFRVTQTWGGYSGEAYGKGSELVVAFEHPH